MLSTSPKLQNSVSLLLKVFSVLLDKQCLSVGLVGFFFGGVGNTLLLFISFFHGGHHKELEPPVPLEGEGSGFCLTNRWARVSSLLR